jgi:hypothetical protein
MLLLGFLVCLAVITVPIAIAWFHFRHKTRADAQMTIRAALERGQELSPALVEKLAHPTAQDLSRRSMDLRRGVLLIAVAIAITIFGVLAPGGAQRMLAISALPFMIGLAYLGLWKFSHRD